MTILTGLEDEDIALEIIQKTVAKCADINLCKRAEDADAMDIIISAANAGNVRILKALRDNNFDVTEANPFGVTALHAVADKDRVEYCRFLLECGADYSHYHPVFSCPLHLACYRQHIEVVQLLREQGASIDHRLHIPAELHEMVMRHYFSEDILMMQEREREKETNNLL